MEAVLAPVNGTLNSTSQEGQPIQRGFMKAGGRWKRRPEGEQACKMTQRLLVLESTGT